MENKTPSALVARLRRLALAQKREEITIESAGSLTIQCPQCGAGRAKQDGITQCGYCGFEFTGTALSDGLHIKKEDNS